MDDDRAPVPDQREPVGDELHPGPSVADEPGNEPEAEGRPGPGTAAVPSDTVGTGSYVAISCVAAMGLLLLVLIAGLLISRWLG